jgi:hypothetical protein
MTKKIDELRNMPQKSEVYFKEFEQVGSITGQVYHFKFKTEGEYNLWLSSQERLKKINEWLDSL